MALNTKDYAIVVGINVYPKHPDLGELHGAVNDACEFIKWLRSKTGGSVKKKNIFSFLSKSGSKGPRLHEVQDAFEKLVALSNGGEERIGRRLYIFFSGHGLGRGVDDASLLTADHSRDADKYLIGRIYANYFKECALFDEVFLLMDCCQDYDGSLTDHAFHLRRFIDTGGAHQVRRCYGYATEFGRKAREKELEGAFQGIFSHMVLKGLKGWAANDKHEITARGLEKYVTDKLPDQEPDFRTDDGFVILAGVEQPRVRVEIELSDPDKGFRILDGGNLLHPLDVEVKKVDEKRREVELITGKNYLFVVPIPEQEGTYERTVAKAILEEVVHVTL